MLSGDEGFHLRLLEDDQRLQAWRGQDALVERQDEITVVPCLWSLCVELHDKDGASDKTGERVPARKSPSGR